MFSLSIHHYTIWSDKCYLIVHILWKSILLEISMNCRWDHQPPPHSLLGLMMNSCFGTRFHSSIPENLTMSSRQFVLHLFFSGILSLRCPGTNQIWNLVRYDGWNILSRVITLDLLWHGKVMSCLAHLAGGPSVIVSFLTRLTILPWGNWMTCLISFSWWILCVCKVWPLLEDHVNAISKHVCGTLIFNKNIWSTMLNVSCSIIQTPCMGNVMKFLSPYLKSFRHNILSWISCSACPWEGYTPEICVLTHFSFHCSI